MRVIPNATLDPDVVAEWMRRREAFRRNTRWLWYLYAGVLALIALPPILNFVPAYPYLVRVAFVPVLGVLWIKNRHFHILKCPHCEKPPVKFSRPLEGDDFCPHCFYWLENPRRGSTRA